MSIPGSDHVEGYRLDGLQIAYETNWRRYTLRRAEPRAIVTDLLLHDTMADQPIEGAPARIEPAEARAGYAAGRPGWWRGATLTIWCATGVQGGRAVYRFVDEAPTWCGYLIAWPD